MITTATWSIDRTSLSLAALVLDGSQTTTSTLTVRRDGLVMPAQARSHAWAYDSGVTDGNVSVGSTLLMTAWVLPIQVEAASMSALQTAMDEVRTAFGQHTFAMTATLDGVSRVWTCYAADSVTEDPAGLVDLAYVTFGYLTANIPCHPTPAVP